MLRIDWRSRAAAGVAKEEAWGWVAVEEAGGAMSVWRERWERLPGSCS